MTECSFRQKDIEKHTKKYNKKNNKKQNKNNKSNLNYINTNTYSQLIGYYII